MAEIAFVVSAPDYTEAQLSEAGQLAGPALELTRAVRGILPGGGYDASDVTPPVQPVVATDDDDLITELAAALGASVEIITNIDQAVVAGAAAGAVPVPGILATSELVSVIHTAMHYTEPGIAGAAAGDVTVPGILTTDRLVKVLIAIEADPPGVNDLTDEFTVTDDDTINNTGGTSSAGETLVVVFARDTDLTAEFTVTDDDEIDNTGGTDTTFGQLAVTWKDVS